MPTHNEECIEQNSPVGMQEFKPRVGQRVRWPMGGIMHVSAILIRVIGLLGMRWIYVISSCYIPSDRSSGPTEKWGEYRWEGSK
jgi:hypothetical protein